MKRALITGINGQDGSYLAEFLLTKGYEVHGIVRRSSSPNYSRIQNIKEKITLHEGDLTDFSFITSTLERIQPHEIYNLAAQSHVHSSFRTPIYTSNVNYIGCLNILEVLAAWAQIKSREFQPKMYQASTSEMFGDSQKEFFIGYDMWSEYDDDTKWIKAQDENTSFNPQSPYAIAKLAAHHACILYRKAYGVNVCCGILFNHDSPRRGDEFVTKKITNYLKALKAWVSKLDIEEIGGYSLDFSLASGYISALRENKNNMPYGHKDAWLFGPKFPKLKLGNLDASRDFGYAGDYVKAMWLMLQQDKLEEYVIGTGQTYTVREFLVEAFSQIGVRDFSPYVEIDEMLKRPAEVPYLRAYAEKAYKDLEWNPEVDFKGLVKIMLEN